MVQKSYKRSIYLVLALKFLNLINISYKISLYYWSLKEIDSIWVILKKSKNYREKKEEKKLDLLQKNICILLI